ncbi:hypothetical protein CYLTODRAFT_441661 [Cylindrobasidium torrendii FP15055 ss-10]|uniref:Cyclin-D1-binding protein 1 n=1 Tax=Cylindrobasidium torrendii FP15055 ss-10 TaxID=1314674 RepID=A0A0D7BL22_9AGAR|nr:hypothetical protein CYLTODRAFT_441661 [Cylindrobasidium torrendii FP15055 ss-10]
MSEKEKALQAFRTLIEVCDAAAHTWTVPSEIEQPATPLGVDVLQKDLLSLFLLLRASTTKLALAMDPVNPQYTAVHSPLQETSKHIAAVVHCVSFLDAAIHGATIRREFERVSADVINAVKHLLAALADPSHSTTNKVYLARVGEVHELIDVARSVGPKGLSNSNITAVRKLWALDEGALKDGLSELDDVLNKVDGDEDEDDGWDELGFDSEAALNPDERARVQQAHTLGRIINLLHARTRKDILSPPASASSSQKDYDALAPCSAALLAASDDFISALHPPHDRESLSEELEELRSSVTRIREALDTIFALQALERLSLNGEAGGGISPEKWFKTCFGQIDKNIDMILALP